MIYDSVVSTAAAVNGLRSSAMRRSLPAATFEQDSELYRVLASQPGHGAFRRGHRDRVAKPTNLNREPAASLARERSK
jgi:hypothetical protein